MKLFTLPTEIWDGDQFGNGYDVSITAYRDPCNMGKVHKDTLEVYCEVWRSDSDPESLSSFPWVGLWNTLTPPVVPQTVSFYTDDGFGNGDFIAGPIALDNAKATAKAIVAETNKRGTLWI